MASGIGSYGVWRAERNTNAAQVRVIEDLGYGAMWVGGSPKGDLKSVEEMLGVTTAIPIFTGIVNIWDVEPTMLAASYHRIEDRFPGRFTLGIGVGHREYVGAEYIKPYEALVRYVDRLQGLDVPRDRLVLAALGPKVLTLAVERTAGAHPYLMTPVHTRRARATLGQHALLAPEQKVVVTDDDEQARAVGRFVLERYLAMGNYRKAWKSLGFEDSDIDDGGSDRLVDTLTLHGPPEVIAEGLSAHLAAGADHVAIQNSTMPESDDPIPGLTKMARVLFR